MYYYMTHVKTVTISLKIKMLLRKRIEPLPTENQFVSEVKNIKNPTTLIIEIVIKGMWFKTVMWRQFYELGC